MFLIPHVGTIIWVSIIFLIVFFVLSKFAWKPLLKALDERESSVENALKSAEAAKKKLTQLEHDQQLIIQAANKEKERLIKEGIQQRENIVAEAAEKAEQKAAKMIEEAQKRIRIEREAALLEMKNQIASLSIEIATKVVKGDLEDKKRHERLVKDLINEVELN